MMMICLTREPLLQWYSLSWLLHVSYSPYRQTHRSDTGRTCKIFPGLFLAHLLHRCNTNGVPSEQGQKDTTTVPARQSRSQPLQQWWQEQTILWAYVLLWKLAATLFPIKKNNICFVTSCTLEQKGLRWLLAAKQGRCSPGQPSQGSPPPGVAAMASPAGRPSLGRARLGSQVTNLPPPCPQLWNQSAFETSFITSPLGIRMSEQAWSLLSASSTFILVLFFSIIIQRKEKRPKET